MTTQDKILITGGSGFLGSYILKYLVENHYENIFAIRSNNTHPLIYTHSSIHWLIGDILDLDFVESAIENMDYVIHCAAKISYIPSESESLNLVNCVGTEYIVNACLFYRIKKLIHISSIAAFGYNENIEIIDEKSEWVENKTNTAYAISKQRAEREVWRAIAEGLSATILCPSIMIGTGNWENGSCKIFRTIANGLEYYPIGSTGFVDVRDVVRFILLSLENNWDSEKFILNSSNQNWQNFIQTFSNKLGIKPPTKPLSATLGNLAWRWESLKSYFKNEKPIITKETIYNSSINLNFDNSKSKSVPFTYTPFEKSIDEIAKNYLKGEITLLDF